MISTEKPRLLLSSNSSKRDDPTHRAACPHITVTCINPYETVRKYECKSCREIMMCSCDESFGRKHRPHQLQTGSRLETRERVSVTLGFQPNICRSCRGQAEIAAPMAALHGQTSKVRRYYWREISMEAAIRFASSVEAQGIPFKPLLHLDPAYRATYERIEREVVEEIKTRHAASPKYVYEEKSQESVLRDARVEIIDLKATYADNPVKGKTIAVAGEVISVEEFVGRHFEAQGMRVIRAESVPFHVIFGTLIYPVVCDPRDNFGRFAHFGDRKAFDREEKGAMVTAWLPEDFGTPGYAERRAARIATRVAELPKYGSTMIDEFNWLLELSDPLRQYLWAHREDDVARARKILHVLSPDHVRAVLSYLCADYWHHYLGWPDLLVTNEAGFFFVEVKGSGDKLSEEQKAWIEGNSSTLHLPFKLVKVHREKRRG